MDILNDLTKCNFYYYILRSDKAYLIFNYLQITNDNICIEDALVRRQPIKVDDKVVRVLNKNLKKQYNIVKELNELKSKTNLDLNEKIYFYTGFGYLLVIKYLLETNRFTNYRRKYETFRHISQALSLAAESGHLNIVQYLVSKGEYNESALRLAAQYGHLNIVKYLLQPVKLNRKYKGYDIHTFYDDVLRIAAKNGHLQVVQYLVSKGANIHGADESALFLAVRIYNLKIIQYLISVGANSNVLTAKQKLQLVKSFKI